MQILPNIYLLNGFAYAKRHNFYLVHNEDGNIIIDTGKTKLDFEQAENQIAIWGITLEKVDYVLLTHSHCDHVGNAARLRSRGARVAAGPGDAEGIETADSRTIPYVAESPVPPCKVDRVVTDGDVIEAFGFEFEIIHTPGHTNGSVIYQLRHFGKIIWFVGDFLFARGADYEPQLGWAGGEEFDKALYIKSLKRLSSLPVDCILAGHLIPCLSEAQRLVGNAYAKALIDWR